MVIDQGSMLDRIDYNVERMAVDVKAADKELTVATGYQKKSIKRKIILLLLILVAGMFILLGLKLSSRGSGGGTATPAAPVEPVPAPAEGVESFPLPPRLIRRGTGDNIGSRSSSSSGIEGLESSTSLGRRRDWRRRRKRRLWGEASWD